MRTITEEFSDSDDDWFGFASAQDRKDGHSLRAYLLGPVRNFVFKA
ncbi:hypothetical protein [Burkholderia cenocepacia]|nr:hypothetical protein [Burkholderia cenocepacia]